jgi:hypothetical protein
MKYFKLFIISVLFTSCVKTIRSDFDSYNDKIVLNSIIKANEIATVQLSNTLSVNGNNVNYLNNLNVSLYKNGVFVEDLIFVENGNYKSVTKIEEGNTYKIEVIVPNEETITTEVEVPFSSQLLNFEIIKKGFVEFSGVTFPAVKLKFKNPIDTIAFFQVVLYDLDTNVGVIRVIDIEKLIDPVLKNEGVKIAVFSNEIIKTPEYEIELIYSDVFCLNCLVEFRRISFSYYKYLQSLALYSQNKNQTANIINSPAFNLFNNINNAYGIFGAYNSVYSDTIKFRW